LEYVEAMVDDGSRLGPLDSAFWRSHAWSPAMLVAAAFAIIGWLSLDERLARAWFFDSHSMQWLGAGNGDWWARQLLHSGGRWLIRGLALSAVLVWALSRWLPGWRPWRESAGFVALAMVLAVAIVGALKSVSNVDCPWDLAGFGGTNPQAGWFSDRPDWLPRAKCFPGAHASSGFSLWAFYFLWRDTHPQRAHNALITALLIGSAFAVGPEARGAPFLSHDLAAAVMVWFTQLALYVALRKYLQSGSPHCEDAELGPHS
jgi:membrane-associated PAP2 superfamily phosphatase